MPPKRTSKQKNLSLTTNVTRNTTQNEKIPRKQTSQKPSNGGSSTSKEKPDQHKSLSSTNVKKLDDDVSKTKNLDAETVKMPKSKRPHTKIVKLPENEMELVMVCVEEDLAPCQVKAYNDAKKLYEQSKKTIMEAKANGYIVTDDPNISAIGSITPVEIPSDDDDVIVLDEESQTSGRPKRRAAKKAAKVTKELAKKSPKDLVNSGVRSPGGLLQPAPPPVPSPTTGRFVMAEPVGTTQRVLIPEEHFQKLLPGQFNYIFTVDSQDGLPVTPSPQPQAAVTPPSILATTPARNKGSVSAAKKRPADITPESSQAKKIKQKDTEQDTGTGSWVPLDEYYYSKQEGDPTYREEKGEFRFKCWYCHKMLYNNVRLMMHMQGHIDSEKQQNLDLTDLTQCKHCYKHFDTPFEMQCHVEKVHQSNSNVLLCHICEKDHETQTSLRQHMRQHHVACEMPYVCQLCYFRSSGYSDVVDHFKKRHDSSQNMLCLYCLRVFRINFSKSNGWGLTQNYYHHLQKHQVKNNTKKCSNCKLSFHNKVDAKTHRQKDHMPNYRVVNDKTSRKTMATNNEQVMIKVADPLNKNQPKSLNAPSVAKVQELRGLRLTRLGNIYKCRECKKSINTSDHYKKYTECSLCRFATACNQSYSNHMMAYHAGKPSLRVAIVPQEKLMASPLHCLCGYESQYGNNIANHLVSCSKRTAYLNKPEAKYFEYDDEQEEFNPFEPYVEEPDVPESPSTGIGVPTMFTALGLVKRSAKSNSGSATPKAAAAERRRSSASQPQASPSKPPMKLLQPQHKRSSLLSSLPIKVPISDTQEGSVTPDDAASKSPVNFPAGPSLMQDSKENLQQQSDGKAGKKECDAENTDQTDKAEQEAIQTQEPKSDIESSDKADANKANELQNTEADAEMKEIGTEMQVHDMDTDCVETTAAGHKDSQIVQENVESQMNTESADQEQNHKSSCQEDTQEKCERPTLPSNTEEEKTVQVAQANADEDADANSVILETISNLDKMCDMLGQTTDTNDKTETTETLKTQADAKDVSTAENVADASV